MQEMRRVKRTQMFKHARLWLTESQTMVDCVVCDLTNFGAGLRVAKAQALPANFELVFDSTLFRRQCTVRWKGDQRLGVEFLSSDRKAA